MQRRLVCRMTTGRKLLVALITFITVSELGYFPQVVIRGFYCDDRSIQRPYSGDSVTTCMIILSGFVPFFLIWLTEILFYFPTMTETSKVDAPSSRYKGSLYQTFYWFRKYGRGLIIKLLIIDAAKIFAGEHRPHFIDTCRPDVVCEGKEFISSYTCTNTDDSLYFIRDASKSFPSGHSSVSVFETVFMIWYLHRRVPKLPSILALPLIQLVIALWGIFCPLSRIMDNRHHWWDVLAGSLVGLVAAGITCFIDCRNFNKARPTTRHSAYRDHDIKLISNNTPYKEDTNLNSIVNCS
ncbi:putative phosphatidate phosphatase isoform X2 [Wyeomyia smithii]|uniref:putative phosphatidate phosphatase isoform X2 n=1 Tax=Wyeomyia smithii TaxID=174621 RepID=UPI0024681F84|nr:putative phosphatidate phosphatase isoform X2 [Wyeomyia smithii]XP_055550291.1 putative phosphatidate phosphatase isoform X2 [Wyeomyia smithii]